MNDETSSVDGAERFAVALESSSRGSDEGDDEGGAGCEAFRPVNASQTPMTAQMVVSDSSLLAEVRDVSGVGVRV